jgi:hypothetical protein
MSDILQRIIAVKREEVATALVGRDATVLRGEAAACRLTRSVATSPSSDQGPPHLMRALPLAAPP